MLLASLRWLPIRAPCWISALRWRLGPNHPNSASLRASLHWPFIESLADRQSSRVVNVIPRSPCRALVSIRSSDLYDILVGQDRSYLLLLAVSSEARDTDYHQGSDGLRASFVDSHLNSGTGKPRGGVPGCSATFSWAKLGRGRVRMYLH